MSEKLVTDGQTDSVRDMARAKGVTVGQFQRWLDTKGPRGAAYLLDTLRFDMILPPPGARFHILPNTEVILDEPWGNAVESAGPNTPANFDVHKVSYLYPPTGKGEMMGHYIALNFPDADGSWQLALDWAKSQRLENTAPREVFAVAKKHSNLYQIVGQDQMYLVATDECTFERQQQACSVCWYGRVREASMDRLKCFVSGNDWFLFRKSSVPVT